MKTKALTLTLIAVFIMASLLVDSVPSLKANTETPQLEWSKTYGTYSADAVIQTTDGGYAMGGVNATYGIHGYNQYLPLLVKTDALGELQWAKTYGNEFGVSYAAYSIAQTMDSGYALSGYGGWLLKIDAYGNVQWNKTYGLSLSQSLAIQSSDGGYALAGWMPSNFSRTDVLLVKTDQDGFILWNKTFTTGESSSVLVYGLVETTDGGYALTGQWANGYFWLATTDSEGNLLVNQTYNVSNLASYSESFTNTADGGYILAGGDGSNAWLVKTDAQGNMQWKRSYAGRTFVSVAETVDGGYIAAESDKVVKTGASGEVQWDTGDLLSEDGVYSVIVTEDRGFVVTGGSGFNVWLAKFAPESATTPAETPLPFSTALLVTILVIVIIVAGIGLGLLIYLIKKSRH